MSSDHVKNRRDIQRIRGMDDLWKAVDSPLLTPRERAVVKLKIIEDLSHNEISQRLPVSERTSQRLYKSALKKLESALL